MDVSKSPIAGLCVLLATLGAGVVAPADRPGDETDRPRDQTVRPGDAAARPSDQPDLVGDAAGRLHDLFEREWELRLREDPLLATAVGVHTWDDRLASQTPADFERRARAARGFLAELAAIESRDLGAEDQVSQEMLRRQLEDRVASIGFHEFEIPLNADSGFHTELARLPDLMTLRATADYENYIARLRAFPRYVEEHIALMRQGISRGMTLPRVVLTGIEGTMTAHVVEDPETSVFWEPFAAFPQAVPAEERERLAAAGQAVIRDAVAPGYRTLAGFMVEEYLPAARESLAATELPGGEEYYRYLIRHFTTLDLAPREIHETGLAEVARIQEEMEAVIRQTGFEGDFAAFLEHLRTDPRFYAESPEELLKEAAFIAKKMDGRLPSLFKTLPRLPYGVAPVPAHLAPKYTAGRYVEAPVGGTEPGWYWVNTYKLEARPLYNLEALTLHEAVPGHHLQVALAQELADLPAFRRFAYVDSFGEGWGLYSERLGLEAGFYRDPYSNFGRLTYEMWRACRLVVDTGLHAKGWTRQQAFDFLASKTALSLHEVTTETDRYISWPGQALAYKLGELKIRELRRRAEEALGTRFDVRAFHDALLANGTVTLPILEERVESFIASARRTAPSSVAPMSRP
jgi:uncharacterized protein (DUF885 family)